jgi:LDH2 family malate/lactate/ureidoglycolate dehydrogenase
VFTQFKRSLKVNSITSVNHRLRKQAPVFQAANPERSVGKGIGHFFGAMQIDGFIDKDEFKKQIDEWIHVFRNTKPAPGTNGLSSPAIPSGKRKRSEAKRAFR